MDYHKYIVAARRAAAMDGVKFENSYGGALQMKITDVKIEKFSAPLAQPFRVAFGLIEDSDSWTVKIQTDEGIYGLGSAAPLGFVTGETMETCYLVLKMFAQAFIGFDPMDIAGAHKLMDSIIYSNGSAKCAFDIALYDIMGKKKNLPVYKLLGGTDPVVHNDITIGIDEPEKMEAAARRFVFEKGFNILKVKIGINPQDDAFLQKPVWDFAGTPSENHPLLLHYHPLCLNRFQVCKQADTVLAHFVHEDYQSEETTRRSYDWYEKITTHDSSLSACIFGIMAARLGDMDKSVRYFSESSMLDITNAHHNTGDGIHTANMGGTYMGVVYGFAGLRVKEDGLTFRPQLPQGWKSYRFRFFYQDSLLELSVDGTGAAIKLVSGTPKSVRIWDKTVVAE